MKKVFSANPEATINVECIMNDIDVAGRLSRDVFEEKSASVLERVRAPLQKVSLACYIVFPVTCCITTNTTHAQQLQLSYCDVSKALCAKSTQFVLAV